MLELRTSADRGVTSLAWLKSYHSFSFGDYYDPSNLGFGSLRVINEDIIEPGGGFPPHAHRDMEIITYILEGELEHSDSLGNGSVIRAGEIQKMSAGTGIIHSEFNPSKTDRCHLLQIWILPSEKRLKPMYQQRPLHLRTNDLVLIGSDEPNTPIAIHQDVRLYALKATAPKQVTHQLRPGYVAWLQTAKGKVLINDTATKSGDGTAVYDTEQITIVAEPNSELLLFEMKPIGRLH